MFWQANPDLACRRFRIPSGFKKLRIRLLPDSLDTGGQKPYPERKSYGFKNMRIRVGGIFTQARVSARSTIPGQKWRTTRGLALNRFCLFLRGRFFYDINYRDWSLMWPGLQVTPFIADTVRTSVYIQCPQ